MKSRDPVKHHYVPVAYLRGFTRDGSESTPLWIHDLESARSRDGIPRSTAYENHFYRMEAAKDDPTFVERAFHLVEGPLPQIIDRIRATGCIPDGDDYNVLMNFIAAQYVRGPNYRATIRNMRDQFDKIVLRSFVANETAYRETLRRVSDSGRDVSGAPEYEAMKEFVRKEEFVCALSQDEYISHMLEGIDKVLPYIGSRAWHLTKFEDECGPLICTDNPVALEWMRAHPPFLAPGVALRGTGLVVPLTRDLLLEGSLDETQNTVATGNRMNAARANVRILKQAVRFAYSANSDFEVQAADRELDSGARMIREMARLRKQSQAKSS